MYIALMDSENYSWIGCGTTERKANEAVLREWNSSDVREKITLDVLEDYYGIWCCKLTDGDCIIV